MMRIFKTFFIACLTVIVTSCVNNSGTVTVINPSNLDWENKYIVIPANKLKVSNSDSLYLELKDAKNNSIPYDLLDEEGKSYRKVGVVLNIHAGGKQTLSINWESSPRDFKNETAVRLGKKVNDSVVILKCDTLLKYSLSRKNSNSYSYQTDGPAWENDKVAYRHYFDRRNARDIFGKKEPGLVMDGVGLNDNGETEDNYHVLRDWGRDILSVGNSLGAGGIAIEKNDSIYRLGVTVNDTIGDVDISIYKMLNNGPLLSSFKLDFVNWKTGSDLYTVSEEVSITPGNHAYKNTVKINGLKKDERLIVGLVNTNNRNPISIVEVNDDYIALITHDKQTYNREYFLGMALVVPKKYYEGYGDLPTSDGREVNGTYYARIHIQENQEFHFYFISGWELENKKFRDRQNFIEMVKKEINIIVAQPLFS